MSATPLTDAYLEARCKGENKQSWVEFAQWLELKLKEEQERAALWQDHAEEFAMELMELERPK